MPLTRELMTKIAALSKIEVSDTEEKKTLDSLNKIFTLIEEMRSVDTKDTEPMSHPQDITLRMREDSIEEKDWRGAFEAIAIDFENSLFLVPKVIE